jgi:hypothetical protein
MIKAIEKTLNLKFKTATKINLKPRAKAVYGYFRTSHNKKIIINQKQSHS